VEVECGATTTGFGIKGLTLGIVEVVTTIGLFELAGTVVLTLVEEITGVLLEVTGGVVEANTCSKLFGMSREI